MWRKKGGGRGQCLLFSPICLRKAAGLQYTGAGLDLGQRSEEGEQAFPQVVAPWAPHLQGQGVPLGGLAHEALLFALLELPEVLLDQEGRIELADRDFVV